MVHLHGLAWSSAGTVGWVPQFCCMWACLFSRLKFHISRWLGSKKEEKEAVSFLKTLGTGTVSLALYSLGQSGGHRFRPGTGLGKVTTLSVRTWTKLFFF